MMSGMSVTSGGFRFETLGDAAASVQEWVALGKEAEGMEHTLAYTKYYQVQNNSWEQQLCEVPS